MRLGLASEGGPDNQHAVDRIVTNREILDDVTVGASHDAVGHDALSVAGAGREGHWSIPRNRPTARLRKKRSPTKWGRFKHPASERRRHSPASAAFPGHSSFARLTIRQGTSAFSSTW